MRYEYGGRVSRARQKITSFLIMQGHVSTSYAYRIMLSLILLPGIPEQDYPVAPCSLPSQDLQADS